MKKYLFLPLLVILTSLNGVSAMASSLDPHIKTTEQHFIDPIAPHVNSTAHILIDADSGKILAKKNIDVKNPPASLTKVMTVYVISKAIQAGQISLEDKVTISKRAWKTPGSKMFVKEGQRVSVKELLKGIIVDSGNDACVAAAEYIAGNETNFASLMNKQAKTLGMNNTNFTDSTGLPDKNLYTTAKDLAILSRAVIKDFPENYHWFKQKWFSFNGIKQPNRNRLLWRNPLVDGIKTGHTDKAGHTLIVSAKKDKMRLIAVILGASSDAARADAGQKLINFGFRFYETHKLYEPLKSITDTRVWKGKTNTLSLGLTNPLFLTIPTGSYHNIDVLTTLKSHIEAPLQKGEEMGDLIIKLNNKVLEKRKLIALSDIEKGGLFSRLSDSVVLSFKRISQ